MYDAVWGPRRVALKVLHPSLADSERVRAQFLSEAGRLQAIAHPSVVKVLAVGELPDGRPYLAMERLDGETLASVLARGALPLAQALDVFEELCAAVSALHDRGLVHRDLKPENVFLVGGKHAVLLDFGIAKELAAPASTTTIDGAVRGTPAYMAPERFFGQPAGIATDVYELALVLYAMLAGQLPWEDHADPEARLSPRPLVELASVPDELDVEIRRALSTRAQNRPASAGALLEVVRAAAARDGAPTAAETARMRPASGGSSATGEVARTPRPPSSPWFGSRQHTTDRGKTPLAWAPTEHATPPAPPAVPRRRWRAVVVAFGLAGVAAGAVAWRLGRTGDDEAHPASAALVAEVRAPDAATVPTADDPWAPRPVPPTPELPAHGPALSLAEAREEAARALRHLPADTSFVVAALVGPLRRDPRFGPLFDKLGTNAKVAELTLLVPPCVRALIAGSEWFVFGSVGFGAEDQGTLIVRGRWDRDDVERCFAVTSSVRTMTDGARLLELPEVGWIDFLDARTVYISVRQDLTAAQVHSLVVRPPGLAPRTRALVAKLPAERALTFAVDGTGGVEWPQDVLPAGSDARAWLRPDADTVAFDVALDVKSVAEARRLEEAIRAEVREVFATASPAVGSMEVTRAGTTVRITGSLSTLLLGMVAAAL